MLLYCYFVVGLLGAAMTPYEVYFYSSGAIEEGWTPKDLGSNRANAIIGYALGGLLSFALMIIGRRALARRTGSRPSSSGRSRSARRCRSARSVSSSRSSGSCSPSAGAAIDIAFSGAYNLAQFLGWEWGKYRQPPARRASRSRGSCCSCSAFAGRPHRRRPGAGHGVLGDLLGGRAPADVPPDPARRERPRVHGRLRERAASRTSSASIYLVVILVIAVSAIPLLFLTNMGQG